MKFVLACWGSRGDIEPVAVVGRELARRGHDVCMAVPPDQMAFVEKLALAAVAYRVDWSGSMNPVLGLPKATKPAPRRIVERGSLELQAYDAALFPWLPAQWAEFTQERPNVGTLTLEWQTDADDEIAAWIAEGEPPISFGFGSIPVDNPREIMAMIGAATAELG